MRQNKQKQKNNENIKLPHKKCHNRKKKNKKNLSVAMATKFDLSAPR